MGKASQYPYFATPIAAFAHRGGWVREDEEQRENTLFAFKQAVDLGYEYLETDVRVTADGVLVAFHDADLSRINGSARTLGELTYAELKEHPLNGIDVVPTMSELFEAFPETKFNIDIKESSAIEPLLEVIREHRADRRVCVASFSHARLNAFRKLAGTRIATNISTLGVGWNVALPSLPRLLNSPGQAFQVPAVHEFRGMRIPVVTPRLIKTAHALDKRVHVWTINEETEMHRLLDLGVDGLISDRIDVLANVLRERGVGSFLTSG